MRKMLIFGMVVSLSSGLSLMLGCARTRINEVSGDEFIKHAQQTDLMGSFAWTSYIGSTHDRAYLEYGHPAFIGSGLQVTVFWTQLSELPTSVVTQIKNGVRPWTNAMDRIGQPSAPDYRREVAPQPER
jgi:hypothetical protein